MNKIPLNSPKTAQNVELFNFPRDETAQVVKAR